MTETTGFHVLCANLSLSMHCFPCLQNGGKIDIVLFQRSGSNGSGLVSYVEMLWCWRLKVQSSAELVSCSLCAQGRCPGAQSAPLLIFLFIFLWALFDSFFPTLCLFSDPKICLGRRFLHPVGSASSTYAWTPFLTNSVSFSENPPLITLVPVLAFHCLKNACEFP